MISSTDLPVESEPVKLAGDPNKMITELWILSL